MFNPFSNNYKEKRLNSNNPSTQGNQNATQLMNGIGRYNAKTPQTMGQRVALMNKLKQVENNKQKQPLNNFPNSRLQTTPDSPTTNKITNTQNQANNGNTLQNENSVGVKVANNSTSPALTQPTIPNATKITDMINSTYNSKNKTIDIGNAELNSNQYQVVDGKAYVNPLALGNSLMTQSPEYTKENFDEKAEMLKKMYQPTMQTNQAFLDTEKAYAEKKFNMAKMFQENVLKQQMNDINEQRQQTSGDLAQALSMRGMDTSGLFSGQMGDMAIDYAKLQNQAQSENALRSMQIGEDYNKNIADLNNRMLDFKGKIQQQMNDKAFNMIDAEGQKTNELGKLLIDQYYNDQSTKTKNAQQQWQNALKQKEISLEEQKLKNNKEHDNNVIKQQQSEQLSDFISTMTETMGKGVTAKTGIKQIDDIIKSVANKPTQKERAEEIRRKIAELQSRNDIDVALINSQSREAIANNNNATKQNIANSNNTTRTNIATQNNDTKKYVAEEKRQQNVANANLKAQKTQNQINLENDKNDILTRIKEMEVRPEGFNKGQIDIAIQFASKKNNLTSAEHTTFKNEVYKEWNKSLDKQKQNHINRIGNSITDRFTQSVAKSGKEPKDIKEFDKLFNDIYKEIKGKNFNLESTNALEDQHIQKAYQDAYRKLFNKYGIGKPQETKQKYQLGG